MNWKIYRLPNGKEVKRYFATMAEAEAFAERNRGTASWAGAIMRSDAGDELYL